MMETLALSSTDNQNNQTLHVAAAGVLDSHHHSPVEEEQMMNLSDMTDLSQEIQEDMVVTMPVAKEILLISLVSQEQALYNPKHENYRNTHRKDMKWLEISEQLGWTELQCKAKWKAMRDQYCRELKRSKFNNKVNVKWKYFKELDFLRPYALSRNYRPRLPPAINTNNTNNNNSFTCSPVATTTNGINNVVTDDNNSTPKFTTIKIEGSTTINFATCDFSSNKSDTSNNLTEEQLSSVLQQQTDEHNWTYITGSNNSSNNNTRLDNHSLSDTQHLLTTAHHHHNPDNQQHHQQQTADETLYNVLVDCMGQIQEQQQQQHQHQQQEQLCQQQTTPNNEDEDDDPIHTFLNIESYFEKELIGLIRNVDMLYNSFNPNYRNVKLKIEAWDEIARKLKKTVKQCRLKWKALRDQFIREHKRLKNRENSEMLPRWKHYDALSFLQKFIKHKGNDFDATKNLLQMSKTKLDGDMDDGSSSPLQQMSAVSDDQGMQQQNDHGDNLCVSTGSVGGYDDMDIDNYIIGDSGSVVDEHNDGEDNEQDTDDRKSQQEFSVFSNHNTNISMGSTAMEPTVQAFKEEHPQLQQQHHQEPSQQQHISMPSLDINDNAPNNLLNPNNLSNNHPVATNNNNSYQHQNPLNTSNNNSNITLASAVTTLDICSGSVQLSAPPKPPPLHQLPTTSEASTNTQPLQDNNNFSNTISHHTNAVTQEDDEVGAFFKAVAMKIRNANLSQVALTDLEIDILRVINTSLRNH
ncbi:probable WRKY transcription factor protein 1 [Calliphora vicina]|uniref:probable WRKY transcription factor protein 1 n=1 Tax=Calliphora vicina TaxID=7373 RepID=UPI00325C1B69